MGDGGLGKVDALFDIAGAEASVLSASGSACGGWAALLQGCENAAARGIGYGVERVVEGG